MRYQIALVGSQVLPVYFGVKEFNPDKLYFLTSDESKSRTALLRSCLPNVNAVDLNCNAYDFHAIRNACERVLQKLGPGDELSFNLTGGTKIMMLAAHTLMHEKGKTGFYINQDHTIVNFPSLTKSELKAELTIKEFLQISGHSSFSAKTLQNFDESDLRLCQKIDSFSANEPRKYSSILNYFRNISAKSQAIPERGNASLQNGINLEWKANSFVARINGKDILTINSEKLSELFFNAGWWELLVAKQIEKWPPVKELFLNCELPFNSDKTTMKNEIDVMINVGQKLIFIECKSGNIRQEDINKMRVIKQTYGGVISKSLLVSRYLPSTTILEKCRELDIEIFYCYAFQQRQVNSLEKLTAKLDELERRLFA